MQLACRRAPVKEDHAIIAVLQEASSLIAVVPKADLRKSLLTPPPTHFPPLFQQGTRIVKDEKICAHFETNLQTCVIASNALYR
jgi:hypothetical protein